MSNVTVDYTHTIQRTRLIKGKPRRTTFAFARCSCGTEWYIRLDRAKHVQQCRFCNARAAALKGAAATTAKYGVFVAVRHTRRWRLEHPSKLERIVATWLEMLGMDYEREYWFQTGNREVFLLDFMVSGGVLAIEVNGSYWHKKADDIQRDERKAEALRYAEIPLLTLTEAEILNGQGLERLQGLLTSLNPALASLKE